MLRRRWVLIVLSLRTFIVALQSFHDASVESQLWVPTELQLLSKNVCKQIFWLWWWIVKRSIVNDNNNNHDVGYGLVDFALDQQYGCADHRQCQPSSLFTLAKTRWTEQIKLGLKGTSLMALHSARKLHDMVNQTMLTIFNIFFFEVAFNNVTFRSHIYEMRLISGFSNTVCLVLFTTTFLFLYFFCIAVYITYFVFSIFLTVVWILPN